MGIDYENSYFGIKKSIDSDEDNDEFIEQLSVYSKEDWLDWKQDMTKEELIDVIVKLTDEVKKLKNIANGG
jgi:hypothetical protein